MKQTRVRKWLAGYGRAVLLGLLVGSSLPSHAGTAFAPTTADHHRTLRNLKRVLRAGAIASLAAVWSAPVLAERIAVPAMPADLLVAATETKRPDVGRSLVGRAPKHFDRRQMTDLQQANSALPGGGANYCAPAAAANAILFLERFGGTEKTRSWATGALHDETATTALLEELGVLMDSIDGSSVRQVADGLDQWFAQRGIHLDIEYRGWRRVQRAYRSDEPLTLDWLSGSLADAATNVMVNFGYYRQQADGVYRRTGGHWVTAIDLASVGDGSATLAFRDPAKLALGSQPHMAALDSISAARLRVLESMVIWPGSRAFVQPPSDILLTIAYRRSSHDLTVLDGALRFSITEP